VNYHRERMLFHHFLYFANLIGTVLAVWLWISHEIVPSTFGLPGALALLSGLGITVGFHRLITHRSFETSAPIRFVFAVLGCLAGQSFFHWVAWHRRHHQFADSHGDPHSPEAEGSFFTRLRTAFDAHAGWFYREKPDFERFIPDLIQDPIYSFVEKTRDFWLLLGMVIPAVVLGLTLRSWEGAFLGFLWGGPVRIFVVNQITFSVNSICHLWGSRPFQTNDGSRNNPVVGVLALGEGWHNNHHAFPSSARQGLQWWQLDISYLVIRCMEILGLAWNVHRPFPEEVERRRVNPNGGIKDST